MKLKDLKKGQEFKFAKITDKTKYVIVDEYPGLIYKSVNGRIHYRPSYSSRLNKEVELLSETELPIELRFIDGDGDQTLFTTETEADFVHVLVKTNTGVQIAALTRHDVVMLVDFLQRHLLIK